MSLITLTAPSGEFIDMPNSFSLSCKIINNMMEDVETDESTNIKIPIPDDFNMDSIEMMINFFTKVYEIKVNTDNGMNISYLDYLLDKEYRKEYIKNYTDKNADPPHCEKLVELYREYNKKLPIQEEDMDIDEDKDKEQKTYLTEFLNMDKYFNNKKLRQAVMLCITAFIRLGDESKVNEIMNAIMKIIQDNQN